MNGLDLNCEYIHYKNRKKYQLLEFEKLRIQENNEWVEAVLYRGKDSRFYFVRSKKEFMEKFIALPNLIIH